MNTEKSQNPLNDDLPKLTKGACVSSVSASDKDFQDLGYWLGRLKAVQDRSEPMKPQSQNPLNEELTKLTEDNTQDDIDQSDPAPAIEPLHTEGGSPATCGVYEYKLTDSPSWLVLLAPGVDLNDAQRTLEAQFGEDRLVEVRPKHVTCGEEH